ncbi:hypothetical protein KKH23_05860 [Patescibacteria group bacterium]|nr:hypothetical protein [Patescibacteria group bacterium]
MLKYIPKVYLIFKLPDGSTRGSFFRQSQRLGDIVSSLLPGGKTELDQDKNIGQLGLENDTIILIKKTNRWPFKR